MYNGQRNKDDYVVVVCWITIETQLREKFKESRQDSTGRVTRGGMPTTLTIEASPFYKLLSKDGAVSLLDVLLRKH